MHQANITMTRQSDNRVCIRIQDENSRQLVVEFTMTLEDYAKAITGLGYVEGKASYCKKFDILGKEKIVESREVVVPIHTYDKDILAQWIIVNKKEEGWYIDAYLGAQSSIRNVENGTRCKYSVYRFQ